MKVCFFGECMKKNELYLLLKKRLELQGVEIVEFQEKIGSNLKSIISSHMKLLLKHRKLDYDIMIITRSYFGLELPLAKIISKKHIVCFIYASPYDILVTDRKQFKPNSFKAKFIHFWYKWSMNLSDVILKESNADIEYNVKEFGVDKKKFRRLFLSADEELFPVCPFKDPEEIFTILYFGTFISFHGVETVIESAKILSQNKDIIFKFCGDGFGKKSMENLTKKYNLSNIQFLGFVDQKILVNNIKESDVCVGIFDNNDRASRVVTKKVFQILCSQKPLITRNSEAIREIGLVNEKNCILIPPNNPSKLAEAIILLKNNPELRKKISTSGRSLFLERLSMKKTSKELFEIISNIK